MCKKGGCGFSPENREVNKFSNSMHFCQEKPREGEKLQGKIIIAFVSKWQKKRISTILDRLPAETSKFVYPTHFPLQTIKGSLLFSFFFHTSTAVAICWILLLGEEYYPWFSLRVATLRGKSPAYFIIINKLCHTPCRATSFLFLLL